MNQTRLDLSGGAGSGPLVPSQEIVTYAGDNAVELFQRKPLFLTPPQTYLTRHSSRNDEERTQVR